MAFLVQWASTKKALRLTFSTLDQNIKFADQVTRGLEKSTGLNDGFQERMERQHGCWVMRLSSSTVHDSTNWGSLGVLAAPPLQIISKLQQL